MRAAAVALAAWATRDGAGVKSGDPRHEAVTEGRRLQWEQAHARGDAWAQSTPYSSCGDLCHWMLRCLGCRDERLVNRSDDGGEHPWTPGANISRLAAHRELMRGPNETPQPGDVVFVKNAWGGHVCVVREWGDDRAVTEDYGQPYGLRKTKTAAPGMLGGAPIGWVLDLSKVVLSESAMVPNGFQLGTPDDNPYDEARVTIPDD